MTRRFSGSLIRAVPLEPTQSVASGIWTLSEALQALAAGNWPPIVADGVDRIPTMTSDTSGGVTVLASNVQAGYEAWNACDGAPVNSTNNDWATNGGVTTGTFRVDFGDGTGGTLGSQVIQSYDLLASGYVAGSFSGFMLRDWTLEWSDDASAWTVIDTRSSETAWTTGESRAWGITNQTAHRYWRLNISASNSTLLILGQIKLRT